MLSDVFDFIIGIFVRCFSFLFELELADSGISLGWFFIAAAIIGLCIKFIINPLNGGK